MPHLIIPFDAFARAIFGVLYMEKILAGVETEGLPFTVLRDRIFDSAIGEEQRQEYRKFAVHLERVERDYRAQQRPEVLH